MNSVITQYLLEAITFQNLGNSVSYYQYSTARLNVKSVKLLTSWAIYCT